MLRPETGLIPAAARGESVQRKLLDILACPIDKHYPLELIELTTREETIVDGALLCSECNRFYPIIDEIPVMLPDDLRNKNEDVAFLKRWSDRLPKEVVEKGRPYNLS
jgi:uncharacterized protein